MLSNPKLVLVQGTLNVVMRQNVTVSCLSQPGSPPVRYTLFKHNQQVSALNRSDLSPALFTLTISSASDVGEYKCKAEYNNSSGGKYSNSLNFTLIGTSCLHLPSTGYCRAMQPSLSLTEELNFTYLSSWQCSPSQVHNPSILHAQLFCTPSPACSLSCTQWFRLLSFLSTEPISKPVLSSPTSEAKKGQNVTLSCFSENGTLPITYLFFKGTQTISPQKTMQKREAAVIFLFIDSLSDFGTYKCKANNSFPNNTKYSNAFNFTLAGMNEKRLLLWTNWYHTKLTVF